MRMTRMKLVGPVLVLTVLAASPAAAQLCVGNPSFGNGTYQASIAASFSNGVRGIDAGFAAGSAAFFGGAGVTVVNFTDLDVRTAGVFAHAGAELAGDRDNKILICPLVRLDVLGGPDIGPVDTSTVGLLGGASVGVIVHDVGDLQVVPFFGLAVVYARSTQDFAGDERTFSDTGGRADVGVGFLVSRNAAITPSVSIPFAAGGADPTFTIRFSFNFGG
jgi:hypothetical protein